MAQYVDRESAVPEKANGFVIEGPDVSRQPFDATVPRRAVDGCHQRSRDAGAPEPVVDADVMHVGGAIGMGEICFRKLSGFGIDIARGLRPDLSDEHQRLWPEQHGLDCVRLPCAFLEQPRNGFHMLRLHDGVKLADRISITLDRWADLNIHAELRSIRCGGMLLSDEIVIIAVSILRPT